jgi:hypothetical protein
LKSLFESGSEGVSAAAAVAIREVVCSPPRIVGVEGVIFVDIIEGRNASFFPNEAPFLGKLLIDNPFELNASEGEGNMKQDIPTKTNIVDL